MHYCDINFKTKKELKMAVASGLKIMVFQPGFGDTPTDGTVYLEGPHFPEPHRWYAEAKLCGGRVTEVK